MLYNPGIYCPACWCRAAGACHLVTTVDVLGQAGPCCLVTIGDPENLMIMIVRDRFRSNGKYGRCFTCWHPVLNCPAFVLQPRRIFSICSRFCTSPASCHLNHFTYELICATIASTHLMG